MAAGSSGVSGSCVPKSLPVKAQQTTLFTGHGRTHLSPMSGDRRNLPGRVNEMLAERVLLLCSSQASSCTFAAAAVV